MVTINLLPWREHIKAYQLKQMKYLLCGAVIFSIMVVIAAVLIVSEWKNRSHLRMTMLTDELKRRNAHDFSQDKSNASISMNSNMQAVSHEYLISRLFADLGKNPQADLCFTQISRDKHAITFTGKARSAADLTRYLLHWDASDLFTEIRIKHLERQENDRINFSFQAQERHAVSDRPDDELNM